MEASGRIYEPFLGKVISQEDISFLERLLKKEGFSLWTTTTHPSRTMISYGVRDSLDNERCVQGYADKIRGLAANSIRGYEVLAKGRELLVFMEKLDPQSL